MGYFAQKGAHLKVSRGLYYHHGIDCGDGWVIHYSGDVKSKKNASVRFDRLQVFSEGASVKVVSYQHSDSPELVLERAISRLGERDYGLHTNNCEHFATWCKTGRFRSAQVERVERAVVQDTLPPLISPFIQNGVGKMAPSSTVSLWRGTPSTMLLRRQVGAVVLLGLAQQACDTVRWFNGELDSEEYARGSVENLVSTGGAAGGACLGALLLPGLGGPLGGLLGGWFGRLGALHLT